MATVKIILLKGKVMNNGKSPLMLQVIHNRKVRRVSIGKYVFPQDWDSKSSMVLPGDDNHKSLNAYIRKKLVMAEKELNLVDSKMDSYTIDYLVDKVSKKGKNITFTAYTKELIDRMNNAGKNGNARVYRTALYRLQDFSQKEEIAFDDIDYRFLAKFEEFHLANGNGYNGLNNYLRTIRAIFNKAIKESIVPKDMYPFDLYKIKTAKTKKKAFTKDEIIRIIELELPEDCRMWHSRNIFMFSFYCMGMNWVDIAKLKIRDIKSGRIDYTRKKNGRKYSIKINDRIQEILNHYVSDKASDDYIFNIIKIPEPGVKQYWQIRGALKYYNKDLKRIAVLAGISQEITSYTARHSWASIANYSGAALGIISKGLGHEDYKTTQTYLKDFENEDIDDFNEEILK